MAQSGYTPILIYASGTASNTPSSSNLTTGASGAELAINYADGKLFYKDGAGTVQTIASKASVTGTVSSVGFTGGLISVATATTTPALTVAGTSGGIPYFSSASTWASSAALAANAIVLGGGAGAAPATTTTGIGVVTALGVNTGTAGAFVVNGGALGTPSSGTVTNLTGTASININGTVGATTPNTGAFTSLSYTTTLTGGTGVIAIGTNQFYKDASGNVGIGTSSPTVKLQVSGGTAIQGAGFPTAGAGIELSYNSGTNLASFQAYDRTGSAWKDLEINSLTSRFGTSGSERMRIDSSGNVGIGTSSPSNTLHVVGSQLLTSSSAETKFNITNTGTGGLNWWIGSTNNSSGAVGGGRLAFYDQTSNAARMVIDNAGNVGIGTSSPVNKLDVTGAAGTNGDARSLISVVDSTAFALGVGGGITFRAKYNTAGSYFDAGNIKGIKENATDGNSASALAFSTQANGGSPTERMRISSAGDLSVGTANSAPGNGSGNNVAGFAANSNGTTWASRSGFEALSVNRVDTTGGVLRAASAGTQVGGISVTSSATAFNTSSDYRLKQDIAPMTGALIKVAALKPVTYKWKRDGSDGEGFIAHELAEVCPQAVTGDKDAVDADGNPVHQGIDTSFLVATLTAAIQEQQALITSLTARIVALESTQP
jgi:hypothetical protein